MAGDFVCAVKLREARSGDTLRAKDADFTIEGVKYPEPALSFALMIIIIGLVLTYTRVLGTEDLA